MADGYQALGSNTTGSFNTASGASVLFSNTTGNNNVASGYQALNANTSGGNHTASGFAALVNNITGGSNTAVGYDAMVSNNSGGSNTAIGYGALGTNSAGSSNTAIGAGADITANGTITNATAIGAGAVAPTSNAIQLGNGNINFLYCKVGVTVTSDRRQKENFLPVDGAEVLRKIRTFEIPSWNFIGQDPATLRHYGPMAQDFFAAFGHDSIGASGSDTTINSGDLAGITLIGVKELSAEQVAANAHAAEQDQQIKELRDAKKAADEENTALKQRVAALEAKSRERDTQLAAIEEFLRANAQPAVRPASFR